MVLITLTLGSCIPDSLNDNPNASTNLDPNLQLTTVQLLPSNDAEAWHRYLIYPGGFMNQWANDWALVTYGGSAAKNDSYFSQLWISTYPSVITEVVDLVERTRGVSDQINIHAAGKVLKVQNFLRLTDYYGDIPYFDAGMAYYTGVFKPKYDTQKEIYDDFFKELKEAVTMFDDSKPRLTADLYYDGNIDRWKRFANSLRLRIAMRLIKVDPAKAKAEAEDAVKSGVFTSNDDICFVKHERIQTTDPSGGNGLANRLLADNKSSTFRLTKELIGTMEDLKDPRIRFYAGSYIEDATRSEITDQLLAHYGSYKKFTLGAQHYSYDANVAPETNPINVTVNGATVSVAALHQFMQPSKLICDPGAPYVHLSYAEVEFLLAEAAYRGYNVGGTAATHFESGLRAAVNQWRTVFGASLDNLDSMLETFVTSNKLQSGKELDQINTQLWILHFMDPFETWSNWRRTGLPAEQTKFFNYRPASNESGGQTPRRIQYPISEQGNNPEGYKEAVDRMGGKDDWMNRIWWDK